MRTEKEPRSRHGVENGEVWGVPGAYVHTSTPLDPRDVELIQNCVRDCQKEWEKEKEPPQK